MFLLEYKVAFLIKDSVTHQIYKRSGGRKMEETKYKTLVDAIWTGNVASGVAEARKLAESGIKPEMIFGECIEPELGLIGDDFSKLKIFLPELISAADVVKGVQEELRSFFISDGTKTSKGKIVLATVSGDLHDVGKNIVKAMLEVNGFEVNDLGVDVGPSTIIQTAKEMDADIIALSALMLPSLPSIKDTIELSRIAENKEHGFKIMIGGGPITKDWADKMEVFYGNDAAEAVTVANDLTNTGS